MGSDSGKIWLQGLNPSQLSAVVSGAPALLVRAGPGTGKTRVLVNRIAHLVLDRGIASQDILAITFTRQAAMEMAERLRNLFEDYSSCSGDREDAGAHLQVSTFHGWAWRFLRNQPGSSPFQVMNETEQRAVVREAMTQSGSQDTSPTAVSQTVQLISRHKQEPFFQEEECSPDFLTVWNRYHTLLKQSYLRDYDDLILDAISVLRRLHGPQQEGKQAPVPCRVLLVDEFQDVSPAQFHLVKTIYSICRNVTVIGDENQAIYGFRGASSESLSRFLQEFQGAEEIFLEQVYRCPQAVLDAATKLIPPAHGEKLLSVRPASARAGIKQISFRNDFQEASWIANTIEKLAGGLSFQAMDSGMGSGDIQYGLGEIAVLYRFNWMAHPLEKALRGVGIPCQVCKRSSPMLQQELAALDALLQLIEMSAHSSALELRQNIVRDLLGRTIPQDELARLRSLASAARNSDRNAEFFIDTITGTLIQQEMDGPYLNEQARAAVSSWLRGMPPALFLRAEQDALDIQVEAVTLMTIHAAKGREFPMVFVAGLEQGVLPWDKGDPDEEKRLLYVALTRTSEQLVLTRSEKRIGVDHTPLPPSDFLKPLSSCASTIRLARPGKRRAGKKGRQKRLF